MSTSQKDNQPLTLEQLAERPPTQQSRNPLLWIAIGVIAVLVAVGATILIMKAVDGNQSTDRGNSQRFGNGTNGRPGGMMGGIGEVTAVSESSITLKSQMNSAETTYTITSSTTVSDDSGSVSAVSGIKVGDRVMIRPTTNTTSDDATDSESSNNKTAQSIVLNPQMPSGGPQ